MDVKYIEQSLATKPWVKAFAVINPETEKPVYAWGCGNVYQHAKCLMDPSNKFVNKTGEWSVGAFWDDEAGLDLAFARNIGGYTIISGS